tara:strand:+ start:136 stop:954 length:819 start_codon:yes stop_codon:yes gene_type:complete
MATVYIAPTAQGSANGTSEANAYAFSSLASAESDAGTNGIIYFLDGTYDQGSTLTLKGAEGLTYESLNLGKAILNNSTSNAGPLRLKLGDENNLGTNANIKVNKFTIKGFGTVPANTTDEFNNCKMVWDSSLACSGSTTPGFGGTGKYTNCNFSHRVTGNCVRYFSFANPVFNNCTISILATSVTTAVTFTGFNAPNGAITNTAFKCDDNSAINSALTLVNSATNCSFFQMGSGNASGGTNCIFTDPLFVDPANDDLRLRPSSPLINAGTAS